MSKLTPEQLLAVNKKNTNIIVSAGAGSGKTTVLKERVLRELKEGINVSDLIILTFTNNAASEMKERIRKIIEKHPEVSNQSDMIDSAYITTFDAFAQSIVKKYNYLLNIGKDFSIIDSSIIDSEKRKILDQIFEDFYHHKDSQFIKLISDFCLKDDKEIREAIFAMYSEANNKISKKVFFENYIKEHFNTKFINSAFEEYENMLFEMKDKIIMLLESLDEETENHEKALMNQQIASPFIESSTYDELRETYKFSLIRASKDVYTDKGKEIKCQISKLIKDMSSYLIYPKDMLISGYLSTKEYAECIINILQKLDTMIMKFKDEHNVYEFSDIANKAIELVANHDDIREEIKKRTFEIMIDEYQDTNDIQETFISYIENNNVYMVGDVKQSIYRFRNANPYIFKSKYDQYKMMIDGFKIDLNKNFRSRQEVINNINLIFNLIMTDNKGGARYREEHQMIFGNNSYDKLKNKDNNYDMEIISYDKSITNFSNVEIEASLIADDILDKVNSGYETISYVDDEMSLKKIEFSDIAILIDKSKEFEIIKRIFEDKGIPTTIDKDVNIIDDDEIYILKNIINLVILTHQNKFNNDYKHVFFSVARSYVGNMSDQEITEILINENYTDTSIYKKCLDISKYIDSSSNKEILMHIIKTFKMTEQLITVGDINERLTKLNYFINNAHNLNAFGMDIYSMSDYFDELLKSHKDMKMAINKGDNNAVKIMTIHKSKGLEFNLVYLPLLTSDFTKSASNLKFKLSKYYGIICPIGEKCIENTFLYYLDKVREYTEELSERIRLFYVALTRAKEKIIMLYPFKEDIKNDNTITIKCYGDLLENIKCQISNYIKIRNIDNINIDPYKTKALNDANFKQEANKITTSPIEIEHKTLEEKHFSKTLNKIIDHTLANNLEFGTFMHYVFEVWDFKKESIVNLPVNEKAKKCLESFLKHPELKHLTEAKIYKEHEIYFNNGDYQFHGFIDLLLEYDDHFDLIDYKLSNISSQEYVDQLNGYKTYIENKHYKPTNIYLYSIKKDILKKLN